LKRLDVALASIGALSIASIFVFHENPFARHVVCAYTGICHAPLADAKAWYKIFYDLGVGSLVTLGFYILVVRLPEYQRRHRLKRGLEKQYRAFRHDCIATMLEVADGGYCADLPDKLMEQDKFREYFDNTRWDAFSNKLNEKALEELRTSMEIFREELIFVLNNTDIPKDQPFEFLKRLSRLIYSIKSVTVGYDESKPLEIFLWDVFAGFNLVTGYRKDDIVKKMISAI